MRAVHIFHRDEVDVPIGRDFVNRDDVRMVQRGCGAGFSIEPLPAGGQVTVAVRKDLQRDLAVEHRVARQPHFSHAARTEATSDDVLLQGRTKHRAGAKYAVEWLG